MVAGHPPRGRPPTTRAGMQPPQGMQAAGTVLGSHAHTPAPTARGWRTPTARPVGGQSGEGRRLTSDAPHNGRRHPPGDALPPPPQRATPARKGACCGAGAGSPRPHRPHPGHTDRGTLAARSRGRAAGGGTAPDTRRPSQRWQATPAGDGPPPPPRHAAPTGHAGQGDSVGPPHPHTRAHSTWVADPNSPPSGRAVGVGTAPDLRRPSQWRKAPPPPGDALPPLPQRATPARKGARCGADAGSPRPHRPHPGHTGRGTLAARSRGRAAGGGTAPDTRRPSQRWQASPPGDGPPPLPRHAAPTGHAGQGDSVGPPHPHTRAHSTWVADHNSPPSARAVKGGTAPDLRRPSQWWKAPPQGTLFRHPHSDQRRPARAHAVGPSLGPQARTDRSRDTRDAEPLAARSRGRAARGGTAPDLRRPSQWWKAPPPGTPFRHPHSEQHRPGKGARCGAGAGSPRPHRPHPGHTGRGTLAARSRGRAAGGGTAPDTRRPSQRWQTTPQGTAPHHPRGMQPPQDMQAEGTVLGPNTHTPAPTARGWRTQTARPAGGQSGEGQRLASDAPHNGGRQPPRGRPSAVPTASNAGPQGRTLWGRCWVPTPASTAPGTHGSRNPGCPLQRTGDRGRDSA